MGKRRKMGWLVASAAAAVFVTAGCGTDGAGTTTDGVLQIGPGVAGNFQRNFNPFQSNAAPGTDGFIYQPLFYFNTVGNQQYGFLGSDYTWSNNNRTLTVNLRKNVKWTDGQPFTADDVVFTFDLLKKYPDADGNGVWNQLSSVTKNGNYQVVFEFKKPNVPFAWYLLTTPIVPKHIWSTLGDPTKASITNPVGTGPYELETFSPQAYTLKANTNYYLGNPPVKEIQMNAFDSNDDETLALVKGEIGWSGIFIPNIDKVFASKNPHNKYWFPPSDVVMLYTNLKDPLLSQLPVRKAISMAIDRQALTAKAEDGYVDVASPTGLILPNDKAWLDPNLSPEQTSFKYDPQEAENILQSAGFKKNSNGIYVSPTGEPLSFTLQIVPGWSDWNSACSLIADQLKKVGIQVTIQEEQDAAYLSNLQNHKFQLALSWTNAGPSPYYLYENLLGTNGGWNIEQWSDPSTDQALQDFAVTTDKAKQQKAIYQLENTMISKLPSIPLFYGVNWYEYNDSQYTGWPNANNPYADPAPYEWPGPAVVVMHLKPRK